MILLSIHLNCHRIHKLFKNSILVLAIFNIYTCRAHKDKDIEDQIGKTKSASDCNAEVEGLNISEIKPRIYTVNDIEIQNVSIKNIEDKGGYKIYMIHVKHNEKADFLKFRLCNENKCFPGNKKEFEYIYGSSILAIPQDFLGKRVNIKIHGCIRKKSSSIDCSEEKIFVSDIPHQKNDTNLVAKNNNVERLINRTKAMYQIGFEFTEISKEFLEINKDLNSKALQEFNMMLRNIVNKGPDQIAQEIELTFHNLKSFENPQESLQLSESKCRKFSLSEEDESENVVEPSEKGQRLISLGVVAGVGASVTKFGPHGLVFFATLAGVILGKLVAAHVVEVDEQDALWAGAVIAVTGGTIGALSANNLKGKIINSVKERDLSNKFATDKEKAIALENAKKKIGQAELKIKNVLAVGIGITGLVLFSIGVNQSLNLSSDYFNSYLDKIDKLEVKLIKINDERFQIMRSFFSTPSKI
ncbi:MAG: hypothetical protein AB8G05_23885 [Oligoflexales bacterium]